MTKAAARGIRALVLIGLVWPLGAALSNEPGARLVHVVLVWLKEPGNAAHRARLIEATRAFSTLPGVEEIRVGEPVPSDRATVDDSFDVGLYMVFSSREALESYLAHPDHQVAQREVLQPLARKAVVYDFWDDGR